MACTSKTKLDGRFSSDRSTSRRPVIYVSMINWTTNYVSIHPIHPIQTSHIFHIGKSMFSKTMNRYHDSCRNSTTRNMTLSDIVERGAQAMSLFFWRQRQTNIELLMIQHTCEENWLVLKRSIIRRTSTNWVDQVSFATGVPLNNDLDELWNQTRS